MIGATNTTDDGDNHTNDDEKKDRDAIWHGASSVSSSGGTDGRLLVYIALLGAKSESTEAIMMLLGLDGDAVQDRKVGEAA